MTDLHSITLRLRAFTLIELLVSVAIIGILVAIVIPVAAGMRENANTAKCISNLRQIGAALMVYSVDNEGAIPEERVSEGRTVMTEGNYYGAGVLQHEGYLGAGASNLVTGPAMAAVLDCPSAIGDGSTGRAGYGSKQFPSFCDYWYAFTGSNYQSYVKDGRVMLNDLPSGFAVMFDYVNAAVSPLSAVHGKAANGVNVLYADGSVATEFPPYRTGNRENAFNRK